MFVLDLMSMRFVAELHVEGHAPVPLSMKYPGQVGPGLTSDLVAFSRCGDAIVAFFAEGRGASAASFAALPFAALSGSAPLRG